MNGFMTWVTITAALCYLAYGNGHIEGSQDPLGARQEVKLCEQEYKTKCNFQVIVYPIDKNSE